ncbi:MAG TPA: CinA family protein [Planctomycetaceae bacterium]|nr:CinA family protein [Planctomycetaceae bacterium]
MNDRELTALAGSVVEQLRARNDQLVLAESCTGGLVAALLTRIPGVSEVLCGSAVVYQVETKARWLRVSRDLLEKPGPVSREVASAMAAGALTSTPHATVSAAITGHLGPGAPPPQDGLAFLAFASRTHVSKQPRIVVKKLELSKDPEDTSRRPLAKRLRRQRSAAVHLLQWILVNLPKAGRG